MKNKGQALVEFVLILPVFIFIIVLMVDMANILIKRMVLENDLNHVLKLKNEMEIENYLLINEIEYENNRTQIFLKKEVKLMKPGLGNILKKPYYVETRGHLYEK